MRETACRGETFDHLRRLPSKPPIGRGEPFRIAFKVEEDRLILRINRFSTITAGICALTSALYGQAPAASARQLGTVKAIEGRLLTITTAAGASVAVTVAVDAPVLQLPPGSTDLKAATSAKLDDIAVGDRILASGKAAEEAAPGTLSATRVILMKSTDIAARNAGQQQDWQRRGAGGMVRSVEGAEITVIAGGTRTLKVETTPKTIYRRYADDSVNFADAKMGTADGIHAGDQLRARGQMNDDRTSITAEEIVSGTFENLSGSITAIDASGGTLTLKDLTSKQPVTVFVTAKSDLRKLSDEAAAAYAVRSRGGAQAGKPGSAAPESAGAPASTRSPATPGAEGGRSRGSGMDLSQMLPHLPTESLGDLKVGDAVMIVASQGKNLNATAVTLLSGVGQILAATPSGAKPATLSPWNLGSPEGGGGI